MSGKKAGQKELDLSERFWSRVKKSSDCWIWEGRIDDCYGRFTIDSKPALAHRVAYNLAIGTIPAGHELHHLCENKSCVNPLHLIPLLKGEHTVLSHSLMREKGMRRKPRTMSKYCKNGHELTEENISFYPAGPKRTWDKRQCKACRTISNHSRAFGKGQAEVTK